MSISTLSSTLSYSQFASLANNGVTKMVSQSSVTQTQITLDSSANRQNALDKLNQVLTSAYEKLSPNSKNAVSQYQANEALTPQKVANNILGFIERRLQQDQAEGATAEQLQSRLDAGLAGFKKGFAEAEEQLKALSLLSPTIQQDLATTNQLVLSGIENLQSQLTKGEILAAPQTANAAATDFQMNRIPVGVALAAQLTQAHKFTDIHYGKAEARSFQFEVTTLEGDSITIEASSSYGGSVARNGTSLVGSYSESSNFSLVVKGDLNADEMTSINNLLNKVNDLAEDFYAGTMNFDLMDLQELAFAEDQIGEFSVALAQSSIEVVSVPVAVPKADASPVGLTDQPEKAFVDKLLSALDDAALFRNPEKLIVGVAQSIQLTLIQTLEPSKQLEHPKNFDDFLARLMAANKERKEQENLQA
jgi:hypothetical protein